ncbi:MAG: DUF2252 family protein [Bryobacteraceae bacterium]
MNFVSETAKYERWLGKHLTLWQPDLEVKHQLMARDRFVFMRGTFYRWAQLWPQICPTLNKAPRTLAVGDLHVENFGTWRDADGRLIWGINDFDEAWTLPYAFDLVRLAASALLTETLTADASECCEAILDGYAEGLRTPRPFVLEEDHPALREMATKRLKEPGKFWRKLTSGAEFTGKIPKPVLRGLERTLPERRLHCRYLHRTAGVGSLGRTRIAAIAEWRGGLVAREAKSLAPSACLWVAGRKDGRIRYADILRQATRCPDPFLRPAGGWIFRRLAPSSSRLALSELPEVRDEQRLLRAMGWETANIHTAGNAEIAKDLKKRRGEWLRKAAVAMLEATTEDWREWRAAHPTGPASPGPYSDGPAGGSS